MAKAKTPFEQAGYTKDTKFKCLVDYCNFKKGEIVKLHYDDNTLSPKFINSNGDAHYMALPTGEERELEVYVENVITPKLKFPCCVPTSEIKDEATLKALVELFVANGATVYDGVDSNGDVEFDRLDCWNYFGVSLRAGSSPFRTDFYDDFEDYNQSEVSSELTVYHVPNLLGGIVASQEAITERLEDNPSVGIDYSVMGTTASIEPLITIKQEVKYTVVIKGTTFIFTQEELDALAEELLGFTTL